MAFKTSYQKKSFVFTVLFGSLVLFLMYFCGLRYLDPPLEYGVAVSFGSSDVGSGDEVARSVEKNVLEKQSSTSEKVIQTSKEISTEEEIVTQQTKEAPVVNTDKDTAKKVEKKIEAEKKKPVPDTSTKNALNNLFGAKSNDSKSKSKGDDDSVSGVKGSEKSDVDTNKYYGNDGLGGDGNYLLKGRRALSKPVKKPDCNEEGVVVVRIEVDSHGNVIKAEPGVKGTSNHSPCLLEPAKKAALATKWNPDGNAPNKQVGLIRYKFVLSE